MLVSNYETDNMTCGLPARRVEGPTRSPHLRKAARRDSKHATH